MKVTVPIQGSTVVLSATYVRNKAIEALAQMKAREDKATKEAWRYANKAVDEYVPSFSQRMFPRAFRAEMAMKKNMIEEKINEIPTFMKIPRSICKLLKSAAELVLEQDDIYGPKVMTVSISDLEALLIGEHL